MKKILLSVVIVALSAAGLNAQEKELGKHRMHGMQKKQHHGMAIQKLNLSEDQKAKFKSLNEGFRSQMQDLKKQDNITVKEWKSRKEKLRADHKSKIQGLLTKDQKDQLEKMKTERKEQHAKLGEKRMGMMKEKLGLTDVQSAKMKDLHSGLRDKIKNIRDNKSLAKEEKREQIKG